MGRGVGAFDGLGVGLAEGRSLGAEVGGPGGPMPDTRNVMVSADSEIS